MIRIPQVRVIDDEGNQLGVMPTPQALEMAQEKGLDLVEVAPMAAPPVARFLDFGQYKYELTKREKENKRRQRSVTFKEVRLSPKIGSGDFETKLHRAVEFLEDGDRIKVTVRFRGRELSHPELGRVLLERFAKQVEEHGVIERQPVLEGKSMFIVLASTHKPKVVGDAAAAGSPGRGATRRGGGGAGAQPPAAAAPSRSGRAGASAEASSRPAGSRRRRRRRQPAADSDSGSRQRRPHRRQPAPAAARPQPTQRRGAAPGRRADDGRLTRRRCRR